MGTRHYNISPETQTTVGTRHYNISPETQTTVGTRHYNISPETLITKLEKSGFLIITHLSTTLFFA